MYVNITDISDTKHANQRERDMHISTAPIADCILGDHFVFVANVK